MKNYWISWWCTGDEYAASHDNQISPLIKCVWHTGSTVTRPALYSRVAWLVCECDQDAEDALAAYSPETTNLLPEMPTSELAIAPVEKLRRHWRFFIVGGTRCLSGDRFAAPPANGPFQPQYDVAVARQYAMAVADYDCDESRLRRFRYTLQQLITAKRHIEVTPEMLERQSRSWAAGEMGILSEERRTGRGATMPVRPRA